MDERRRREGTGGVGGGKLDFYLRRSRAGLGLLRDVVVVVIIIII